MILLRRSRQLILATATINSSVMPMSTSTTVAEAMTTATTTSTTTLQHPHKPLQSQEDGPRVAIIGGSLGGLAAANALQSAGWKHSNIDVYERASGPMHEKGSGLGYVNVPDWEALRKDDNIPMMRRGRHAHRHQGSFFYGDLWNYLYQGLPEGTVQFGRTIETLTVHSKEQSQNNDNICHIDKTKSDDNSRPVVSIGEKDYDLVVVSDGGFSTLRKYVLTELNEGGICDIDEKKSNVAPFQLEPEYAGYVVWRGSISFEDIPKHVLSQLQEGVYKSGGIFDTILLRQAKDNGEDLWTMGTFIETPEQDVIGYWNKATDGMSRHGSIANTRNTEGRRKREMPDWLLQHFRKHFAETPGLVELMECMKEKGEVTPHPQYEFGHIERVHNGRILILGDAAHMASPRTAVGAHTAILDALALMDAFQVETNDIDKALERYSRSGIRHAHELFDRSRQVSSEFVTNRG